MTADLQEITVQHCIFINSIISLYFIKYGVKRDVTAYAVDTTTLRCVCFCVWLVNLQQTFGWQTKSNYEDRWKVYPTSGDIKLCHGFIIAISKVLHNNIPIHDRFWTLLIWVATGGGRCHGSPLSLLRSSDNIKIGGTVR